MITTERYHELRRKIATFDAWVDSQRNPRNGWASYREQDVPNHLPRVSNEERSQVEVWEFVHTPPDKYFVYIQRNKVAPGVVDRRVTATTWTGQILGYGRLGQMYRSGRSLRYPLRFEGINGRHYYGTFYSSSGDYARVRMTKSSRLT